MKVIFLGTPEFAVKCLDAIHNSKHEVCAVVCQMDKPTGRGNKLTCPPAKIYAMENNINVYQFKKIRVDGVETLKSLNADIMVTAAYGQILSQEIIDICPNKIINVHGSLLPKYRGASPIQTAILNGEKITGITIMQTEAGVDTGAILMKEEIKIEDCDTYGTLSDKLATLGAEMVVKALDKIEEKTAIFVPQNEEDATFTKMIKPEEEMLDFFDTKNNIVNKIRAYNPSPVAKMKIGENIFKVYSAKAIDDVSSSKCGEVICSSPKQGLLIKCSDGAVEIVELQAPSSKRMTAKSYLNGKKIELGTIVNE